ncbi:hypothetical protein GQX74_010351 [Glossina fuscipes]|nr:hypothetical protein GQX74_010351 [Glossina fuscipes]
MIYLNARVASLTYLGADSVQTLEGVKLSIIDSKARVASALKKRFVSAVRCKRAHTKSSHSDSMKRDFNVKSSVEAWHAARATWDRSNAMLSKALELKLLFNCALLDCELVSVELSQDSGLEPCLSYTESRDFTMELRLDRVFNWTMVGDEHLLPVTSVINSDKPSTSSSSLAIGHTSRMNKTKTKHVS